MKSSKHTPKARRRKAAPVQIRTIDYQAILARRLDLMAGIELQHGHHHAAEHFANKAAKLREAGR